MKRFLPFLLALILASTALGVSSFRGSPSALVNQTTVTAASGGTLTLVATSNSVQIFTGAANHTIRLPAGTQLYNGSWYLIDQQGTGTITIQDSAASTLGTLGSGEYAQIYLSSNAAATGNWRVKTVTEEEDISVLNLEDLSSDFAPQYLTYARGDAQYYRRIDYISSFQGFGFEPILTNTLGFIDDSFLPSTIARLPIDLTTDVTGVLPEANGGTGESTYSNGQLLIGNGTGLTKSTLTAGSGITITNGAGSISIAAAGAGTGDVIGPASSTDNALVRFDGVTGKLIQDSDAILDDSENLTGLNNVTMGGNLTVDTSTLVTFATSNRVGIGTATPDETLDVVGGSAILPAPAATINVTALANSQYTVSIDETNNTVEFLVKEAGGTTFQRSLGGTATAGGADTQVQFNDAGTFGGDSAFTWNKTTDLLTVAGDVTASGGGSGTNAERFGSGVSGSGNSQTVLGAGIVAGAPTGTVLIGHDVLISGGYTAPNDSVIIGRQSRAQGAGGGATVIGAGAEANTGASIAIGVNALANFTSIAIGSNAIAQDATTGQNIVMGIGSQILSGSVNSLLIGNASQIASGSNQAVFGSETSPYTNVYFGEGLFSTTPSTTTIQTTSASGTDVAGGTTNVAGSKGTGNATAPPLVLQVATPNAASGTTLQSLVERIRFNRTTEFPQEIITPAPAASGYTRLYAKNDGNLYQQTAGGVETNLASGGGGTPGGSTTQIQFNDAGAFGGDSAFVWLATSNRVGILTTPDTSLDVNGTLAYRATNVSLGGNVTDIGTATTSLVRLTAIATTNILGLANGTNGKFITLMNDTGRSATIANEHASASATDRIITGTGAAITVASDNNVLLQYDSSDSRWKLITANPPTGTTNAWRPNTSQTITTTGSGTFSAPSGLLGNKIWVLLISGGGGGGEGAPVNGAGGGAGCSPAWSYEYPINPGDDVKYFIGSGGAAATGAASNGSPGENTVFGSLVAMGGGGGNAPGGLGATVKGNSGGRAPSAVNNDFTYSGTVSAVLGTAGYFNGGNHSATPPGSAGGGAGGGGNGIDGVTNAGDGGPGLEFFSPVDGSSLGFFCGGGGGSSWNNSPGAGGTGGGGAGAGSGTATAGTLGGGGGAASDGTAAAGGPGRILLFWQQ